MAPRENPPPGQGATGIRVENGRVTGVETERGFIAVGFLGKAFVRWERDGRRVHIFNPSAFTLAVFSLALLATNTTGLTWAQEIATTFSLGPRIYTVLFVIGLENDVDRLRNGEFQTR